MSAKHSPGPWHIQPTAWNKGQTTTITDAHGIAVALILSKAWNVKSVLKKAAKLDRYNARLIAAGPEMRAQLERLARVRPDDDQIRALLARIDGE
jgi:hypothetical protein